MATSSRFYLLPGLIVLLVSIYSVGSASAFGGTLNLVSINVSNIDIRPAAPYLEISGFQFESVVDSPTNFNWLWLSSSDDFESRSEEATPLQRVVGNMTVIDGYSVIWDKTFPVSYFKWYLVPVDEYTYRIGFMLAFTTNVTFASPELYLNFASNSLRDEWTKSQSYERTETPPDNGTLANWGLHPATLRRMNDMFHYQTFYLYEFTLSRVSVFVNRLNYVYRVPAFALLGILIISFLTLIFKGIKLSEALALYLGSAFFSLSFLLSYIQLGIGPILFLEELLYGDTYVAILLAGVSLVLRMIGRDDDESVISYGMRKWRRRSIRPDSWVSYLE